MLPFTPAETVLNLSGTRLSDDELEILKYGLKHFTEPLHINKTDVLTTFDFIHRSMSKDLKHEKDVGEAKAKKSYLANNNVNTYKPLKNTLCEHKIIKILRNNKDILITKPDKGNGVIIVNRAIYMSSLYEIINDTSKFLKLPSDPTIWKEGELQRFLRTLNKKVFSVRNSMKTYIQVVHNQLGCMTILRHTN